ncbi:DNA endonuclease RBBP8 [Phytophthora citrophthora]|uniref:DNA endonuclease RBBP8 n=1 Tax=Phytophthora citrophthora TaxID=4793 RepID=A0AAD9GYS0_9STRA|nr:DNA endonuclease RBBP8 [Phytophthora citrophthora]
MEWRDEKKALLAIIRRKEQEATTLTKRFKLLQQTLKEQQKLLDRYQRALSVDQTAPKSPSNNAETSVNAESHRNIDKTSSKHTASVKDKEPKNLSASTWMQKKTSEQWALGTEAEATVQAHGNEKKMEKKEEKRTVFKPHAKRKSSGLAATWAEEKRKMLKKPKWEQNLEVAATGANKENVRAEQVKPRDFAYVEVVRNREERKALPAHDCFECTKYYDALGGIGENDAAAQKNKCSRHRARFEPYQTPDDFWRLSFPDSEPKSPSML